MKQDYEYRWVLMTAQVWIMFGSYYCFDIPAALHNSLKAHFSEMGDGEFEIYFSGLYSVYSFANIFLPLLTGKMRDSQGDRVALVFTVLLTLIGQIIFSYGVYLKSFLVMYLGRIILGWGIESVSPTQNSFVSPFFKNDYLGFTIGMNHMFATFGGILMMYNAPKISTKYGVVWACFSGTFFNLFSLVCTIIAIGLDYHADITLKPIQQSQYQIQEEGGQQQDNIVLSYNDREDGIEEIIQNPNKTETANFSPLYWKVAFFYGFIYTSVVAYINISVGLLSERWLSDRSNPEEDAAEMIALEWFITGFFTPIFGSLIDKHGGRSYYCIASALLCMLAHISIWYIYPFFSMICLGTGLAIAFAGPWTSIIYIVKPYQIGKAYSYVLTIYNSLFSIFPVIVGVLRAYYGTYFYSQMMLSFLAGVALLISLKFVNKSKILDGLKEE